MPRTLLAFLFALSSFAQANSPVRRIETNRGTITYTVDGPFAVTEGDIILGPADAVESYRTSRTEEAGRLSPRSLTMIPSLSSKLWPDATIYYTIDADVPNQQSILDAIAHWNTKTPMKVLPRTTQANYVHMERVNIDAACNSYVGMIGGAQSLGVTNNCPTGSMIHELGHAFGLWHEQQRRDRNGSVTVLYDNIDKRYISQFPEAASATDTSYYDFDSIMHYPASGFTRNYLAVMETVPVGLAIGQRIGLSAGDIDGILHFYGFAIATTTITTSPSGLNMIVDGAAAVSPQSYNWAAGSQHTISVDAVQGTDPRHVFARWSDGGGITHVVTASKDQTAFSAAFIRQRQFRSGLSSGQGSVSVFPSPQDGYIAERVPVSITATPAAGYQFVRWVGNTFFAAVNESVSANPAHVQVGNGTNNYTAVFTTGPVTTITSEPAGGSITADGTPYMTPIRLAWTAGSTHTLGVSTPQYYGNNTMKMQFLNWEDGSKGTRTVVAGAASTSYKATFQQQYLVTSGTSGVGTVTLSPTSPDGFYDVGSNVTLTATPGTGRFLRYWAGDIAGGAASSTLRIDQQKDVDAYFGTALTFRVLNSASFLPHSRAGTTTSAVSPGEIIAIFSGGTGIDLGPASGLFGAIDASGKLPFTLGGTTVTFDGIAAPLLYVSAGQLNVVVPYGVAGKTTSTVRVATASNAYTAAVDVEATAPALFTANGSGLGPLAALNENGKLNTQANPAAPDSVVVLYATGAGKFVKSFPDGQVLGADIAKPEAPVWVRFGMLDGDVLYAGTAPYLVNGAMQVNVRLPKDLISGGPVPVQLIVGQYASQPGTTVYVSGR